MAAKRNTPSNLAVGYVRVSTGQQAELGVSLESQTERMTAYCAMAGLELVNILREEGVSASVALSKRPIGSLLPAILKGGVCHVVALKLDRLFRDTEDALSQTRRWDKDGVSLHLVDFGGTAINTASSMGRMILTMMAGFAEFERNLIRDRTSAALCYKKQHRQVFNHTPLGFQREGGNLVVDSAEQAVVVKIKDLRSAGLSLKRIAANLNAAEIPTKRAGGRWHDSTVRNVLGSTLYE